jgi:hypothetical protein
MMEFVILESYDRICNCKLEMLSFDSSMTIATNFIFLKQEQIYNYFPSAFPNSAPIAISFELNAEYL